MKETTRIAAQTADSTRSRWSASGMAITDEALVELAKQTLHHLGTYESALSWVSSQFGDDAADRCARAFGVLPTVSPTAPR